MTGGEEVAGAGSGVLVVSVGSSGDDDGEAGRSGAGADCEGGSTCGAGASELHKHPMTDTSLKIKSGLTYPIYIIIMKYAWTMAQQMDCRRTVVSKLKFPTFRLD